MYLKTDKNKKYIHKMYLKKKRKFESLPKSESFADELTYLTTHTHSSHIT